MASGLADRLDVVAIVLAAPHKRFRVLRQDQTHGVAKGHHQSSTVMRAGAVFHRDSGRRQFLDKGYHLCAAKADSQHGLISLADPIQGEDGLRRIDANAFNPDWLRVLGATAMHQVDERVCHHPHAVALLLGELEPRQRTFEFILLRNGPFHVQPSRMDGGIEQRLPPALRRRSIARVFLDVRNEPHVVVCLAIVPGVEPAIEVEVRTITL
jgi:hypothetical protein